MTDKRIRDGATYGLRWQCLPFREVLAQSIANLAPTAMPTVGLSLHSPEVIKHMEREIEAIHTQKMLKKSIEESKNF